MDVDTVIGNPPTPPGRSTSWFDKLHKGAKSNPTNHSHRKKWYSKLEGKSLGQSQNPKDIAMWSPSQGNPSLDMIDPADADEEDNTGGDDEEDNTGGDDEDDESPVQQVHFISILFSRVSIFLVASALA
jgi:hypothetical protein